MIKWRLNINWSGSCTDGWQQSKTTFWTDLSLHMHTQTHTHKNLGSFSHCCHCFPQNIPNLGNNPFTSYWHANRHKRTFFFWLSEFSLNLAENTTLQTYFLCPEIFLKVATGKEQTVNPRIVCVLMCTWDIPLTRNLVSMWWRNQNKLLFPGEVCVRHHVPAWQFVFSRL